MLVYKEQEQILTNIKDFCNFLKQDLQLAYLTIYLPQHLSRFACTVVFVFYYDVINNNNNNTLTTCRVFIHP